MGGIVGYGAYIPRYRITSDELAHARGSDPKKIKASLGVEEKSVAGRDEDAITMAVQAAKNALKRAEMNAESIGAVYVGSESHPYAVKPSATIIGQALGLTDTYFSVDMEFACKGGSAAFQAGLGLVASNMTSHALVIGSDTAQAEPGDILEYSAAAGSAAFILSNDNNAWCVTVEQTLSISTDTPDFWRRSLQAYPQHAGRFTAKPAYFAHVAQSTKVLCDAHDITPADIDYVIFHQPNGKFPVLAGRMLGFSAEQLQAGLLSPQLGNPYTANVLLGLTAVLDQAQPLQTILMITYGSGSGSDAFLLKTTENIVAVQNKAKTTREYLNNKTLLSFLEYQTLQKGH